MVGWAKSLNDEYLNEQQYRMNQVIYLLTMVRKREGRREESREAFDLKGQKWRKNIGGNSHLFNFCSLPP